MAGGKQVVDIWSPRFIVYVRCFIYVVSFNLKILYPPPSPNPTLHTLKELPVILVSPCKGEEAALGRSPCSNQVTLLTRGAESHANLTQEPILPTSPASGEPFLTLIHLKVLIQASKTSPLKDIVKPCWQELGSSPIQSLDCDFVNVLGGIILNLQKRYKNGCRIPRCPSHSFP